MNTSSRNRKRRFGAKAWLIAICALPTGLSAAPADPIVVRVGNSSLAVSDVARRLAALAPFQRAGFGASAHEVRLNFLQQVLVPELLRTEEARRQGLAETRAFRERERTILSRALADQLQSELSQPGVITARAIQDFFEANRAKFETPRRIRIWRILVADEAQAARILRECQGPDALKKWAAFARESSQDKATHLRDGDLGFVREDGSSDVPEVRVDPELFRAADRVKDGELVPSPVREGKLWAAVWRRGSMPFVSRTLEEERDSIRFVLIRQKLEQTLEQLSAELRAKHLHEMHPELLEYVTVNAFGDIGERERPGVLPRGKPRPTPEKTDRGYR